MNMELPSGRRTRSLDRSGERSENSISDVSRHNHSVHSVREFNAGKLFKDWRSILNPQGQHSYTFANRQTSSSKNEIRLVRLYPVVSANAPLVCDLRVVSLDEKPEYSALSYYWGDLIFDQELICEGKCSA
jgi:hypothetical protein